MSNRLTEYEGILQRLGELEEKFDFVLNLGKHHKELDVMDPLDSKDISSNIEVYIKPKAYFKIVAHASKHANSSIPKKKWVEVIGLLTGKVENQDTPLERIVVADYWPIGTGDAISVNILTAEPVMEVYKNKPADHFIVGWSHSHPSYTPFLSQDDVDTQMRYQAFWEESIALVIDPSIITPHNYGFSVFRLTENRDSYFEVENKVEGLTPAASYDALTVFLSEKGLTFG